MLNYLAPCLHTCPNCQTMSASSLFILCSINCFGLYIYKYTNVSYICKQTIFNFIFHILVDRQTLMGNFSFCYNVFYPIWVSIHIHIYIYIIVIISVSRWIHFFFRLMSGPGSYESYAPDKVYYWLI